VLGDGICQSFRLIRIKLAPGLIRIS